MWMWLTVQCACGLLSSDGLLCGVREMDDGGIDDRCEQGSSSERGHILAASDLAWSNVLAMFEIKEYVGHGMKYNIMDKLEKRK